MIDQKNIYVKYVLNIQILEYCIVIVLSFHITSKKHDVNKFLIMH